MAEDLGERTEDATPKRRAEAREEGNVAKSSDLAAALVLLAVTLCIWIAALQMLGQGKMLLGEALSDVASDSATLDPRGAWDLVAWIGASALRVAAPVLLFAWAAAFLAQFLQIGWVFSPKSARPNFRKINPLNGFKRIFGLAGVVKSGLDSLKVGIVIAIAALSVIGAWDQIVVLPYLAPMQALAEVGRLVLDLALRILAVLLALGALDFLYQRWRHGRELRMTKQQVKDEMKETDGDPEVKRRRVRMQREIANQRISAAVPKADVVVTNPEHISVAIQYDPARMNAPKVVAKGADFLAMRIRVLALQHGIPIVERKPLARALYREVAVNQEVPPGYYKAVAEILAYVYRLSGKATA